jgi:serine-type D-Ala-D-Ala carboxypeptidase/endopeptidase (penicillin-binding protein 4)
VRRLRRRSPAHAAGPGSGTPRRRRGWPPLALAVAAVGALGVGVALDRIEDPVASGGEAPASRPATPVLSPRRAPEVIAEPIARRRLAAELDMWVASVPAEVCVSVHAPDGVLYEHRVDEPMVPASTQKLLTATGALLELGPDHRFRTAVLAGAGPVDGVLAGDLAMVGGGDPLLHSADYVARYPRQPRLHTDLGGLADAVVAAGVRRIEGAVVGDERRYDRERYVASWPGRYISQNQSGPLSALSVNDGFARFPTSPEDPGPLAPAADPAANAAAVLTRLLRDRGVEVAGEARSGDAPDGLVELASVESPPVVEIARQLLAESDNETGELLLKELGLLRGGQGSTGAGATALDAVLREAGIAADAAVVADGSGLSLENRVTCRLLIELLARPDTGPAMVEGLAVAAQTGTLADRFGGSSLEGRLRGKTGSLNSVAALAGVVEDDDATLTFAYVANGTGGGVVAPEAVGAQGALAELLLAHPRVPEIELLGPRPPVAVVDPSSGAAGP